MNLLGIGTLIDSVGKIAGDLITTDKERLEVELRHRELDQAPMMGQIAINRAEAQHRSLFVAGWRPFIGWNCGLGFTYEFFLRPLVPWALQLSGVVGVPPLPSLQGVLMELTIAMLGLGTLRTIEKARNLTQ